MYILSIPHKLRLFGIALAVPLSLFLTLSAVIDLPPAQANHHAALMPHVPQDPSSALASLPGPGTPAAPSNGVEVSIVGSAFNPPVITVTAGTVVTWTNLDGFDHTTTSDIGSSDPWDSGSLGPGGVFTKTFNIAGSYGYHCGIHPSMQGTVVVLTPQPPTTLVVTAPSTGAAAVPHTFTARVNPITTTQPLTYFWQATGQAPLTRTHQGLSDTVAFTWASGGTGMQWITVTAANLAGSISATQAITIVPPAGAGVTDVSIVDFAFQPQDVTITVGSTVRWINAGQQAHTTTSDVSSPESWDSGILDSGGIFTRTFNVPGVYAYLCTIHPNMSGSVTVQTQVYLPLMLR